MSGSIFLGGHKVTADDCAKCDSGNNQARGNEDHYYCRSPEKTYATDNGQMYDKCQVCCVSVHRFTEQRSVVADLLSVLPHLVELKHLINKYQTKWQITVCARFLKIIDRTQRDFPSVITAWSHYFDARKYVDEVVDGFKHCIDAKLEEKDILSWNEKRKEVNDKLFPGEDKHPEARKTAFLEEETTSTHTEAMASKSPQHLHHLPAIPTSPSPNIDVDSDKSIKMALQAQAEKIVKAKNLKQVFAEKKSRSKMLRNERQAGVGVDAFGEVQTEEGREGGGYGGMGSSWAALR